MEAIDKVKAEAAREIRNKIRYEVRLSGRPDKPR
jgi:hypothetical protein